MKLKILFFVLGVLAGFGIAYTNNEVPVSVGIGALFGLVTVGIVWGSEFIIKSYSPRAILGGALGMGAAALSYFALTEVLGNLSIPENIFPYISAAFFLLLFHIGITIGVSKGKEAGESSNKYSSKSGGEPKILDTSVIIDGRIADVAEVGFINGPLIVPKFIIKELQHIADSSEPIKRVRGRRGLDVLKRLQKDIPNVSIRITSQDFPEVREADLKLVELAAKIKGVIITNDYNLNKVAGLQNVKILNLNQLSNALKPVVLPGETMNIHVVKEGKEDNQGIGYLEDGTMVVVDEAKRHLGNKIDVSVTSVLQTPTGRMIFSKVKDDNRRSASNG